jgi:hypothetical protein
MDESVEQEEEVIIEDVEEEEKEEEKPIEKSEVVDPVQEETIPDVVPSIQNVDNENVVTQLSFNDMDAVLDEEDNLKTIEAPKSIERLEEISTERAFQRRLEEEESDDERIQISTEQVDLRDFDDLDTPIVKKNDDSIVLDGIEELY